MGWTKAKIGLGQLSLSYEKGGLQCIDIVNSWIRCLLAGFLGY